MKRPKLAAEIDEQGRVRCGRQGCHHPFGHVEDGYLLRLSSERWRLDSEPVAGVVDGALLVLDEGRRRATFRRQRRADVGAVGAMGRSLDLGAYALRCPRCKAAQTVSRPATL